MLYFFQSLLTQIEKRKKMDHAYHIYFDCRTIELLGPPHISFGYLKQND